VRGHRVISCAEGCRLTFPPNRSPLPRMNSLRRCLAPLTTIALLCGGKPSDLERNATPPPAPKFVRPTSGALFVDEFKDGSLAPWSPDRPDIWSVRHGVLRADWPDGKQQHSFVYAGADDWTDYAVDLDVCQMRGVDKGVAVRVEAERGIGVDLRGPGYQDVLLNRQEWSMGRARVVNGNGVWHHLRVEARGDRYRVIVNGELLLDRLDAHHSRPRGRIALPAYTGGTGQCTVYYDNVVVTALTANETAAGNESDSTKRR
jgi:Domain of Unknown Function (DUF1080)